MRLFGFFKTKIGALAHADEKAGLLLVCTEDQTPGDRCLFRVVKHHNCFLGPIAYNIFFNEPNFSCAANARTVRKNKVEVLTEERDVARSHEEELFAKLTDRTEDLEALQESYVSLTDRYSS